MRGQKATTIKDFANVSKSSKAPIAKPANAHPMRMTRSRSAAALVTEPAIEVAPATRKRKLAATEGPVVPALPAKKPKKLQEATTPRKKKPTTINAYFSPAPKETAIPETVAEAPVEAAVESVAETVAETAVEAVAAETVAETIVEAAAAEAAAETVVEAAVADSLNERATELLARLRSRKKAASETRAEETRAIQDSLRARRIASKLAPPALQATTSKFAEAGGITASEQHTRDVHRQFVSIPSTHGKALPRELRKLNELFQALDHTVMFGGQTSVIYHRIRRGVEAMAKRTFGWRELGQILALYPESYTCKPMGTMHEGRNVVSVELSPMACGMDLAVEIEARREEFGRRLLALVDSAHRSFLASRGYDAKDIDATQGLRHPSFDVESTPLVTPLPLPPTPAAAQASAAGPVATFDRERLRHLLGTANAKLSENPHDKPPTILALPPTPAESPLLQPADPPKGTKVSSAKNLLERIREKQRAKEAAQLAAAQAVPQATRTMHSRLPAILEAISFLFYSERRNVLPYFFVVDKLVESKGLDRPDISNHIVALAGFIPEWCNIFEPGTSNKDGGTDVAKEAPVEPSPDARLSVTRTISMREAKARLIAKIEAIV
ncbi:replication licensing factor Cdt1 [Coemansia sp. BCRC 34962]|nr:replication licensing factor Cdt1 [Coemansia sp. BCRC 34962]